MEVEDSSGFLGTFHCHFEMCLVTLLSIGAAALDDCFAAVE